MSRPRVALLSLVLLGLAVSPAFSRGEDSHPSGGIWHAPGETVPPGPCAPDDPPPPEGPGDPSAPPTVPVGPPVGGVTISPPPVLTPAGEAELRAVVRDGLAWLARHQEPTGKWDVAGWWRRGGEEPTDGAGNPLYDEGVTGLALLAFLQAGADVRSVRTAAVAKRGLAWLRSRQDPEGCIGSRTSKHFVTQHAIATEALCRGLTDESSDAERAAAARAVAFLLRARNPGLAWRYGIRPGDNDTATTSFAVAALAAARDAGLEPDPAAFRGARHWLERVTTTEYGPIGYRKPGDGAPRVSAMLTKFPSSRSRATTASGVAIALMAGDDPEKSPLVARGFRTVLEIPPRWNESDGSIDFYSWYWATRAARRIGGRAWAEWSGELAVTALRAPRRAGPLAGSIDPVDPWGTEGGRIYSTALVVRIAELLLAGPAPAAPATDGPR